MTRLIILKCPIEDALYKMRFETESLDIDGSLFIILSTEYDNFGNVSKDFLDVIKCGIECGYQYVNTIVYPSIKRNTGIIIDNTKYVVWFVRDKKLVNFNKDVIREKHIWKDIEWGKRSKNYNPKGKDPGNVWIPTIDNGKAVITNHILLDDDAVVEKIIKMTEAGDDYIFINKPINLQQNKKIEKSKSNRALPKNVHGNVIFGTSEKMSYVQSKSIKTIITSPPYWNLKDYFKNGQIGQESYKKYLSRMKLVLDECYRSLRNDGSMWININIRSMCGKTILIPSDLVQICKKIGFYYKGIVIWHKSSGIPTTHKNLVDRHEYVLAFTKMENFSSNISQMVLFSDYKNNNINGGTFWNINRKAGSIGKKYIHPAIYPTSLVERIILSTSDPGDYILDPFLGSGTSLIASINFMRNFIGYEYNEGFSELINSRIENEIILDKDTYDVQCMLEDSNEK